MPEKGELATNKGAEKLFSNKTNLLSTDNPIEAAVLQFATQIDDDTSLTNADQIELVRAVKQDAPYSRFSIIDANMGLLSTLAYPFKSFSYDNTDELIDVASFALLESAVQFDTRTGHNFTNFAGPRIQEALANQVPWAKKYGLLRTDEQPIHTIIRFASSVKQAVTPSELHQKAEQDGAILSEEAIIVLRENSDVLQYIHLTDKEIHETYGISYSRLYGTIKSICERLGVANRATLALLCLDAGIPFEVTPLPENVTFTAFERQLAPLLHLPHVEIAEILGKSKMSINNASTKFRNKIHARGRTEAVLIAKIANIEPLHEAFLPFTTAEQLVLPLLILDTDQISDRLNISNGAVNQLIMTAARRVNVSGRRGLALYLYEKSYEFEISEPTKPLHELFNNREMVILENLHLTNKEIAEIDGSTEDYINSAVNRLEKRTDAKNRIELMLQARTFDTGERRAPDERTKRDKLIGKLGLGVLDVEHLHKLLDELNERQRNFIRGYYLSEDDVNWRTVANEHETDIHVVIATAKAGILRIRKMVETGNKTDKIV